MAKTKRRQAFAEQYVFSAEEFEASGIRELSFEELLKVNGGKVVKDDPWTDKNSETCPYSSNAPRTDSSSGSSGGGSSSSNYGSSSGGSSSTNSDSSGYSEPVTGSHSDDSGGSTCDGWNNYWNGLTSGGSSGGGSSGSTGGSSGGSSSGGDSSAPPSSSPSEPVTGSDSDDTGGSTCDGWNNYWNGLTSGGSSGGGSSGSTGGSSGNSDSSGGSSSDDSSDDDCSSGGSSGGGSSWSGDYTPPVQSQPVPKPNKGEETSPTQGGGTSHGEAVMPVKNQGKNAGAANSGTKIGGASSIRELWDNAVNKVNNVVRSGKDAVSEKLARWNRKEEKGLDYSKTEARYGSFPDGSQEDTTAWGWQYSLSENTKKHISQLHPKIQTATKNMMVNLYNKGVKTEIICSMRTSAEQDQLYNIGRDSEGNVVGKVVTYVKGGESFHNFGLAFDVEVYNKNGKKNWDSESVDWQSVIAEGQAQGFEAGATWKDFKDFPHFQNACNLSTKQLRDRLVNNQMQGGWVNVE